MSLNIYLELTKPRLVLLALAACATSLYIASDGCPDLRILLHTLMGAVLVGCGANGLNQFAEREYDAKMTRTQGRPLPSGRIGGKNVLVFGGAFSLAGVLYLLFFVNKAAGLVGAALLVNYIFIYTPLKRKTPLNTFVGAVSGALPVVLGWTAVDPVLSREALILFAMLFAWQIPHVLAIAWVYREDYLRGGFRMFAVGDATGKTAGRQIVAASFCLFALSLVPAFAGIAGLTYLFMAVFFGVNLCGFALYLASHRLAHAKQFVCLSIVYQLALNVTMMVDKA